MPRERRETLRGKRKWINKYPQTLGTNNRKVSFWAILFCACSVKIYMLHMKYVQKERSAKLLQMVCCVIYCNIRFKSWAFSVLSPARVEAERIALSRSHWFASALSALATFDAEIVLSRSIPPEHCSSQNVPSLPLTPGPPLPQRAANKSLEFVSNVTCYGHVFQRPVRTPMSL